jgi:hypothetical protein
MSLEQLRKQAKDLIRAARAGENAALARFDAVARRAAAARPLILATARVSVDAAGSGGAPRAARDADAAARGRRGSRCRRCPVGDPSCVGAKERTR